MEAYQSDLWNRLLGAFLRQTFAAEQLFDTEIAGRAALFYRAANDTQRGLATSTRLPLPSSRAHLAEGPIKTLVDATLGELGLRLRDLEIPYPRDSFFSKGERPAAFVPQGLSHRQEADETAVGRQKLILQFALPRGAYATILVRRVYPEAEQAPQADDPD